MEMDNRSSSSTSADTVQADLEHGSIFFVGTATVVLRYAGFTILTDPNFLHQGDHIHLGYGLQATRLTDPAIEMEDLPPVDLVLLSHMHEDHFDREVAQRLNRDLPIVTTGHAAVSLRKKGFTSVFALRTWGAITIKKGEASLKVTAMPGRHAPGPLSSLLPPVMGSMLEFQNSTRRMILRLYISGDTLMHEQLREIPQRYPEIDLALLHLGGTRVLGVTVTMDAKQGVQILQIIAPRIAIPIHFNDYDAFKSPLEDFQRAVQEAGLEDRVQYINAGESYSFAVSAKRWR